MNETPDLKGVSAREASQAELVALRKKIGSEIDKYDTSKVYTVDASTAGGTIGAIRIPKTGLHSILVLVSPTDVTATLSETLFIVQENRNKEIVGGSTFVLNTKIG